MGLPGHGDECTNGRVTDVAHRKPHPLIVTSPHLGRADDDSAREAVVLISDAT